MQTGSVQIGSSAMASAIAQLAKAAYFDPADTNQDGVVSPAEEQAYALKHPELATRTAAAGTAPLNPYGPQGLVGEARSTLDLYA